MLKNELPSTISNSANYSTVNIFKTGFDNVGWFELKPLVKRDITLEELYNRALRAMWMHALSVQIPWSDDYLEIGMQIREEIDNNYIVGELDIKHTSPSPVLDNIIELASNGLDNTHELLSICHNPEQFQQIKKIGETLRRIDQDLIRIAYENPHLRPLIAQFTYGKDNMTGWELRSLAEQTESLYRDLAAWSKALKRWIEGISFKTATVHKPTAELEWALP